MKMRIIFCMLIIVFVSKAQPKKWTWLYKKLFLANEQQTYRNKTMLTFARTDVQPFTQLIFSWNAVRPKNGYFSFLVQVRNTATKSWGKWHHMIDWGVKIQRSYFRKSDGYTHYVHVRLQAESGKKSDAFRVKAIANKGAHLSKLRGLAVALSDFNSFKPEHIGKQIMSLPSVHIKNVPQISQLKLDHPEKKRICSPTSCTIVTSYLTGNSIDPILFANNVFDYGLQAYGSWPFNVAHAYEQCNGKICFFTARLNSFSELHKQLQRGIPTVVSVRGCLTGAPKSYDKGHLLVVVGLDAEKKVIITHDSALPEHEQTKKSYPIASFIPAWERSHRLVYWAEIAQNG